MSKPNRLQNALKAKAEGSQIAARPTTTVPRASSPRTPSRTGKVMISAYMPPEVRASFRLIQARHPEKKMQELMAEAFNDLFAKYNVPQTAKLE